MGILNFKAIETTGTLRPGDWGRARGARKAAAARTVTQKGAVENWVEL